MSLAFMSTLARALPSASVRSKFVCRRPDALTFVSQRRRASARWFSSTPSAAASSAREAIESSNVMVFSGSYCGYCARVKALFTELAVPFTVWELDLREDGADIRSFLAGTTGQTSVPNVFIGGKHVGGCDDTFALYYQGKLLDMINAAQM